jgi:hypothetical protein
MYVNYAKTSSLEFSSDAVFAMNKNVKAVRFDSNREGTFTTTMEVFPMDIIPMLFGTTFSSKTVPFAKGRCWKNGENAGKNRKKLCEKGLAGNFYAARKS